MTFLLQKISRLLAVLSQTTTPLIGCRVPSLSNLWPPPINRRPTGYGHFFGSHFLNPFTTARNFTQILLVLINQKRMCHCDSTHTAPHSQTHSTPQISQPAFFPPLIFRFLPFFPTLTVYFPSSSDSATTKRKKKIIVDDGFLAHCYFFQQRHDDDVFLRKTLPPSIPGHSAKIESPAATVPNLHRTEKHFAREAIEMKNEKPRELF